jgi:hypothetical protein
MSNASTIIYCVRFSAPGGEVELPYRSAPVDRS